MATFKIRDKETGKVFTIREKENIETQQPERKTLFPENIGETLMQGQSGPAAIARGTFGNILQEATPAAAQFLNQLGGGIPGAALHAGGVDIPRPKTLAGKGLETLGATSGFIAGLPLRIANLGVKGLTKLASSKGGRKLLESLVKSEGKRQVLGTSAKRSAQFGLATALETPTEDPLSLKPRAVKGGVGALTGAIFGSAEGAVNRFRNLTKDAPRLAEEVRANFKEVNKAMQDKFGQGIDTLAEQFPESKVDLKPFMDEVLKLSKSNKKVKGLLTRFEGLKKFLPKGKGKALPNNRVSLRESQDIFNDIKQTLSKQVKAGRRPMTPEEFDIFQVTDKIRSSQLSSFGEKGFKNVLGDFSKVKQDLELIKDLTKITEKGKTLAGIGKGLKEPEVNEAMIRIFTPELIQKMGGFESFKKVIKILPSLLKAGLIGAAAQHVRGGISAGRKAVTEEE